MRTLVTRRLRAASVHTRVGIGFEFLGYRIEELIGRGGMGVVYRAYDLRLKRTVALKLVAPELALDEHFRERFSRESELAMALEHPNVVPIHDAGDVDGRVYLAMRYVEGSDLRSLLRADGALDPIRASAICGQVAAALDAAHARGLVHRDVKPSNVLLDAGDHVYLADFGLTRRLEDPSRHPGDGHSLGTPAYLAPEQVEGHVVDGRADVYSLGCLLYECLTGEAPFPRDSPLAVAWAHLEEEPPRASERNSELPEAMDAVIRKAMAKDPDERYQSCAALMYAAEAALGLRQPRIFRRREPLVFVAATLAGGLAAALLVGLVTRGGAESPVPPVTADTLVRIDPATNAISAVIYVGARPSATAVVGRRVWVYSHYDQKVKEIDAASNEVREATRLSASPRDLGLLTGPVLAADAGGAWAVGVDERRTSLLTRVFPGGRGKREYRVDQEARAVAAGEGAVWVLSRGTREHLVQRVDPATGEVTARTRFPASSPIDSLAVGLGAVWVVSSSTAVLYRIDPRSAAVSGHIDLGERAGRPIVRSGSIWVGVSDSGSGTTVLVDPRKVVLAGRLSCCPLGEGYDTDTGHGSTWAYDRVSGTVLRWSLANYRLTARVHVADPPFYDGLCLTSIAAGAGAVWVTVASSNGGTCVA